jgi:diguanylate cyclase (GGDEF)-like protein
MYKLNQAEKTKEIYKEYAYRDTLTGAYSRLYFEKWSKSKIENARFIHEDISVVMIDINRYKYINDTYGHTAGDKALQRVAAILQMSVKNEDLVVRYGGDEFLLVLANSKYEEADKIMVKINSNLMKIEDLNFSLSLSYGIEQIGSYKEMHSAIQRADEKMYESKNAYKALLWF